MLNLTFQLILLSFFNSFGDICDGKDAITSLAKIVETTFNCDKNINSLVITGDYIKFSEFTNDKGELKKDCSKEFEMKSIRIFATDRVTLDNGFWMAGIEMIVMAPIWNITRPIEINLNGLKPADPQQTPQKKEVIGQPGVNGIVGQPGNFGGNFVGMGGEFINGESLNISVSGGDGQDGGDGGDGGDGEDGLFAASMNYLDSRCFDHKHGWGVSETNVFSNLGLPHVFELKLESIREHECQFRIKGEKGKSSGDGGDSGAGGMPGNAGNILFLGVKPTFKQINSKGNAGKDGRPGRAGKPGIYGWDMLYTMIELIGGEILKSEVKYDYGYNLTYGVDGKVDSTDLRQAEPPKSLNLSEIANIVVDYRGFLLENLDLSNTNDFKVQFYYSMEKNKHIMSMFDTLALVSEMKYLEKNFHKLHKSLNFLPLYQSLSNRTVEYARKLNSQPQRSVEDKKVLTYLYTTILGREYNLKDRSESNLIVDIGSYLDQVKESIQKYKESNRVHAIGKASENYKNNIDIKIKEANDAIDNAILPELEDALKESEHNVDAIMKEIIILENESRDNYQKKASAMIDYRNGVNSMMALDLLRYVVKPLTFLPKYGSEIVYFTEEGATLVEDVLEFERNPTVHPTKPLPRGVLNSRAFFEGEKTQYLNETREMIKLLMKVLRDDRRNNNHELISELKAFDERLNLLTNLKDIVQLRKELSKVVKRAYDQGLKEKRKRSLTLSSYPHLSEQEQSFDINQTRIHKRFLPDQRTLQDCDHKNSSRAEKMNLLILTLVAPGWGGLLNILRKSKDHRNTVLKNLCEALTKEKEYLSKIEEYGNFIRTDLGPCLDLMGKDVLKASKSLGGKSSVSLDVTKWQIQSKLKKIQTAVLSVTEGLKNVRELFKNTFSKVNDAINTLVNMFDRIQSYQEEKTWADHIAVLSTAGSKSIEINDAKLASAIDYLDVVLNSNTVIQQYQIAVDSFKQFVFPFADLYFKELILPHSLNYGQDLGELVVKAETQVNHLKKKLDQYRFTAKKIDSYLGTGQFNSKYRSTKPFFVWEYNTYSKMLSALLSGKKVLLFADVRKSMSRYDAVKFTEMEFNFKFSDKKTQSVVNNVLKSFDLSAFHMGNSYFRTEDQYFLLTTGPLDFGYSLEKDKNGIPLEMTNVHGKIKKGDAMLSPYASWSLQLTHISEINPTVFNVFNKYKTQIQLELIGRGHFLYKDKLDVDIKLDQYYTPLYKRNETKP